MLLSRLFGWLADRLPAGLRSSPGLLAAARRALAADDLPAALRLADALLSRSDALAGEALLLQSTVFLRRHQPDLAVGVLTRACRLQPNQVPTRLRLGLALVLAGKPTDAIPHLERVLALEPSKAAHRLRGRILRQLGEPAAAAADLLAGMKGGTVRFEEALALAETLLNAGDPRRADRLLARLQPQDDPRWRLLHAAASDPDAALPAFAGLAADPTVGPQAVRSLVALVGQDPGHPAATAALDAVPVAGRDDGYWTVAGNVRATARRYAAACEAWRRVDDPTDGCRTAWAAAARLHLAECAGRDDDAAIAVAFETGLVPQAAVAELGSHLAAALVRRSRSEPPAALLSAAVALQTRWPELVEVLIPVRGLLHFNAGQWAEAEPLLAWTPAFALPRARCLLELGRHAECEAVLAAAGPDAGRLRVALHAAAGDWQRAADAMPSADVPPVTAAAVYAQAARVAALAGLPRLPAVCYWEAVALTRQGRTDDAARRLAGFPPDDPLAAAAAGLQAWLLRHAPGGRREPTGDEVRDAILLAPAADRRGPAVCRNVALAFLAAGAQLAGHAAWEEATISWEKAVAYLGVALARAQFLEEFAAQRGTTYQTLVPAEAVAGLVDGVVRWCEALFAAQAARLREADRPQLARRVEDLPMLLRCEIEAGRAAADRGGIPTARGPVVGGPGYVAEAGEAAAFAGWLRERERAAAESPLAWLRGLRKLMGEADDEPGDEDIVELERLFSPLRVARQLDREGRLAEAVDRLRADDVKGLAACNPAFPGGDGPERCRGRRQEYLVDLLVRLGAEEVATEDAVARAVERWREAVALAGAKRDAVVRRIRDVVLGRIKVLARPRPDEAIRLLEATDDLCGDEQTRGPLAQLYANRGVQAAMEEPKDWEAAVRDLRRARELNAHSPHISYNLVMALRGLAGAVVGGDAGRSRGLLEEALALVAERLAEDPEDARMREMKAAASLELLLAGKLWDEDDQPVGPAERGRRLLERGDAAGAIVALTEALGADPNDAAARRQLAAAYKARAMRYADAGAFDEALQCIRRARQYDPDSDVLRRNELEMAASRARLARQADTR